MAWGRLLNNSQIRIPQSPVEISPRNALIERQGEIAERIGSVRGHAAAMPPSSAMNSASSFDHLVGDCEHAWWDCQAERLGSLEIDCQLELGRRLHRQIARPFAFYDAVDVEGRSPH